MELVRWLRLTTLTVLGLGLGVTSHWSAAIATSFSAREVDQNRYVLLASSGGSRLTILEQISDTRPCWQQNGNEVEALLLNFDFTGLCGRYSDLNGYSVRAAGKDFGLRYRLQVQPEGNSMVLYAAPRQAGPALEIGRTRGVPAELGRIYLNPGWRVTRRVYEGQTVGHIYLTSDQSEATLIANARNLSSPETPVATRPQPPAPPPVVSPPSPRPGVSDRPSVPEQTVVAAPDPAPPSRRSRRRSLFENLFRLDIHFSIDPGASSERQDDEESRENSGVNFRLRNY